MYSCSHFHLLFFPVYTVNTYTLSKTQPHYYFLLLTPNLCWFFFFFCNCLAKSLQNIQYRMVHQWRIMNWKYFGKKGSCPVRSSILRAWIKMRGRTESFLTGAEREGNRVIRKRRTGWLGYKLFLSRAEWLLHSPLHFTIPRNEAKVITLPKCGKDYKFPHSLVRISSCQ